MKKMFYLYFMILMGIMGSASAWAGDVDWTELEPIHLDKNAEDLAVSSDGKMAFILAKGELQVFSFVENAILKKIQIDKNFDRVTVMGKDNTLILSSSSSPVLKRIQIEPVFDIDVSGLPFKGPQDAPVVIAVFDDYQCGYCARLNPLLEEVLKKYPREVKLVIKHFPLRFHTFAQKASMAALAAGNQGKFWEFHDLLFQNTTALNDAKVMEIAKQLDLDTERFIKDKDSDEINQLIRKSATDGMRIGVQGTPTIYINGKLLQKRSIQGFDALIRKELKKTPKPLT